jgi:polyprenyl P-hydroxybenzoate/phenylacrylic acid decarboxylase-like protein
MHGDGTLSSERLVVGMAATEGLAYGTCLVETLHASHAEVHLVLTPPAEHALGDDLASVLALAGQAYAHDNQAARISSGSFLTRGMVVAPCDGAALAAISLGLATNLLYRAADVTLKERRPLVLGLVSTRPTATELEHRARAAGIPGLAAVPLEGPPREAVALLLDQL